MSSPPFVSLAKLPEGRAAFPAQCSLHRVPRRSLPRVITAHDNRGSLRIIALGRKNFLFASHDEGAQNLAVLQSTVGTCQLHDVKPYA